MFPKDGIFETSGGVFVGHNDIIQAADLLFGMCIALEYNVNKVYTISEGEVKVKNPQVSLISNTYISKYCRPVYC